MEKRKNTSDKLTKAQCDKYMENDGANCPFCESENIDGDTFQSAWTSMYQDVACLNCEKEWRDVYELSHIETTQEIQSLEKEDKSMNDENSASQARRKLDHVIELVKKSESFKSDDYEGVEDALTAIMEDPLEILVRSGWVNRGAEFEASEYIILLCTGGPASRIIGNLDEDKLPESAHIEHQDWGTPWTELPITPTEEKDVLKYANFFYFGE